MAGAPTTAPAPGHPPPGHPPPGHPPRAAGQRRPWWISILIQQAMHGTLLSAPPSWCRPSRSRSCSTWPATYSSCTPPDVLGAREIAAVPPPGAVLAGRLLAQPPTPPANQPLATWPVAHGLTVGHAGYWEANSTTLASGGRVHVRGAAVAPDGKLMAYKGRPTTRGIRPLAARRHVPGGRRPGSAALGAGRGAADFRPPGPDLLLRRLHHHDLEQEPAPAPGSAPGSYQLTATCKGCGAWPPPAGPGPRRR
jgi:hypothetical protein